MDPAVIVASDATTIGHEVNAGRRDPVAVIDAFQPGHHAAHHGVARRRHARMSAAVGKVETRPLEGYAVPKACVEQDPVSTGTATGPQVAGHFCGEHDGAVVDASSRGGA